MKIFLGKGRLTWDKVERVGGRYGFFYLTNSGDSYSTELDPADLTIPKELIGKKGRLVAKVLETRKSTHVGDGMRGFFPETPAIGENILLGSGTLQTGTGYEGNITVGLKPARASKSNPTTFTRFPIDDPKASMGTVTYQDHTDAYKTPWLDPKALYRAHEQTVELYFERETKSDIIHKVTKEKGIAVETVELNVTGDRFTDVVLQGDDLDAALQGNN